MRVFSLCMSIVLGTMLAACGDDDKSISTDDRSTEYRTLTNPSGLGIVRRPAPTTFTQGPIQFLPSYDSKSTNAFQIDLRGRDLSTLDLSGRSNDLNYSVFDSKTVWPKALPADFSPSDILEIGKNPGLGIRLLHDRGITGRGIGVAVIDQPLLVDHVEYAERLKSYEEIHWPVKDGAASMHGPAVASFAVGKTVGVASEADLYFIAELHGTYSGSILNLDFTWLAQAIDRVLEINAQLSAESRIRVISISVGWGPNQKGYDEVTAAVARAAQAEIFVVSSSLSQTHGYNLLGLGRASMADPDRPESYGPGSFWADSYYAQPDQLGDRLLAPMDSRTAASRTGIDDYSWGGIGGLSWAIPYLAGVYALACQVKPDITPDVFWSAALKTGATIPVTHSGNVYQFGKVLDPVKLMDELSK
jgi:hypothetical protein